MLYSEKLELFEKEHPCQFVTVDGARFRYILCGREGGKTLVLLNGGMNTLEMWMDYVDDLSQENRVLLFDYPQELRTNQELSWGCTASSGGWTSGSRSSSGPVTAAWCRKFMCRNIRAKPAD